MGKIYNDKILMFKHEGMALKAATELDNILHVDVSIYESFVMVSFANFYENEYFSRTIDRLINKCIDILKKYNLEYECKELKF